VSQQQEKISTSASTCPSQAHAALVDYSQIMTSISSSEQAEDTEGQVNVCRLVINEYMLFQPVQYLKPVARRRE
jgi:hypothetical protein